MTGDPIPEDQRRHFWFDLIAMVILMLLVILASVAITVGRLF